MEPKIVLYQEYPKRDITHHGVIDHIIKSRTVSTFPATQAGLDAAIEQSDRHDAILVKISKDYFSSTKLLEAVVKKIEQKRYVKVFKPANKMPGG